MEKRLLGKTNESLSIIGFGGIVAADVPQNDANNYVAEALDSGINYFDVAPTYSNAEERLGVALEGRIYTVYRIFSSFRRSCPGING